jgi:hypothetical protein
LKILFYIIKGSIGGDVMADNEEPVVGEPDEEALTSREGKYLPPIHRIKMPVTRTQTARIRWLYELGYKVKDISNGLNVRYQQVRNMVTTIPKRAAREDLPELKIELVEMEDVVDMLLGDELERTHLEDRKQQEKAEKARQRKARQLEPVGAELDDEDYREDD